MKDKRGLSSLVTTLIIILLSLMAITLIWLVVKEIIQKNSGEVEIRYKCLEVNLNVVSSSCNSSSCTVVIKRNAGGGEIGGIKLLFSNATGDSGSLIKLPGDIPTLGTLKTSSDHGIINPNKIDALVYLIDSSGNEKECSQSIPSFSF